MCLGTRAAFCVDADITVWLVFSELMDHFEVATH